MASHIQKTNKRKSKLGKDSKYRANTNTGFTTGSWQAHHILCYKSVNDRNIEDNKEYVEDCLWITDWDLNDAHNMIGLPLNSQYRATDGKVPVNLPSHQVDHNTNDGYRDEVTQWLEDNVWNALNDKKKAHEINAKDIADQLKAGSDHFRTQLTTRGARKKGTIHCWGHRFPTPPAGVSATGYKQEKKWYYPFSMAKEPNERSPGIDYSRLVNIFKRIK